MIHTRYSRRRQRKIKPNTAQRKRVMHAYVAKGHAPARNPMSLFSMFRSLLWKL